MTVEITRLANGLRVVSQHMPHLETVSLGVWVAAGRAPRAGARARHLASAGAHGLQGHRAAQRQRHRRGDRGGRRRAQCRHQPRDHRLLSRACSRTTSASRSISWPTSCRIPRYAEDELEREREVILQEIAATRDSPDEIAYELLQDAAFPGQPIGRPILGTTESVDELHRRRSARVPRARTTAPAAWCCRPPAHVDHAALVRHAEALFGGMNGGEGGRFEPARYVGWHAPLGQAFRAEPSCHGLRGRVVAASGVLYRPGVLRAVRRGHVLPAVPGGAGAAGSLLRDLFELTWGLADTGPVLRSCRDGAGHDGRS